MSASSASNARKLQLKITNEDEIDGTFYKDVGGKRHAIVVRVVLRDMETSTTALGLKLPIVCSIRFDNERTSVDQSEHQIATFFDAPFVTAVDGTATVSFRINDVSRNHGRFPFFSFHFALMTEFFTQCVIYYLGNKKFRLHLSCDVSGQSGSGSSRPLEVNPCTTRPIEVLSKKPKEKSPGKSAASKGKPGMSARFSGSPTAASSRASGAAVARFQKKHGSREHQLSRWCEWTADFLRDSALQTEMLVVGR